MTTLVTLKTHDYILLGADREVTSGNVKLPVNLPKINKISNSSVLAASGSLGQAQQVFNLACREILIDKISTNFFSGLDIYPSELSSALAQLNFIMPLDFVKYEGCNFLISGVENNILKSFVVGDDGSILPIETYYSEGSGSNFALPILEKGFRQDLPSEEGIQLVLDALIQANKFDIFTDGYLDIYKIDLNSIESMNFRIRDYVKKVDRKNKAK